MPVYFSDKKKGLKFQVKCLLEAIHMKCQVLFYLENEKKIQDVVYYNFAWHFMG